MNFTIQIKYITGDSFGSRTETDTIGCVWKNLDKAKDALKRIKAQQDAINESDRITSKEKLDSYLESIQMSNWYCHEDRNWKEDWKFGLYIELDDGTPMKVYSFWNGYFERIEEAEIVINTDEIEDDDDDLKIIF